MENDSKKSGVTCISSLDISADGVKDVVVGKSNQYIHHSYIYHISICFHPWSINIICTIIYIIHMPTYININIGRDDGVVELYRFNGVDSEPVPHFKRELNESITTLAQGNIFSVNSMDLVVSNYSGNATLI